MLAGVMEAVAHAPTRAVSTLMSTLVSINAHTSRTTLQRAQKVQQILLVGSRHEIEYFNDPSASESGSLLFPRAGMRLYGLQEVPGTAVMQKEDSLAEAPQGRRAKHTGTGETLHDVIRQTWSHVVHQQIGI